MVLERDSGETTDKYYFPIVIEQEKPGSYSAFVVGLEGVNTVGDSAKEAENNAREAIELRLSGLSEEEKESLQPWTKAPEEPTLKVVEVSITEQ